MDMCGYMSKAFSRKFYDSAAWRRERKRALTRDIYTCYDCGGYASEVHHIIELTPENIGDPAVALNPDNLMCLCWQCHAKRTQGAGDVPDGYRFGDDGQLIPG